MYTVYVFKEKGDCMFPINGVWPNDCITYLRFKVCLHLFSGINILNWIVLTCAVMD